MLMVKFSFLIPVYNTEKTIKHCLDSVLNQTYEGSYEIILYDDASKDNSKEICLKYQMLNSPKIRLIEGEINIGLGAGRVRLLKYAAGEYIIFVDSDDYVELTLLEKINQAINLGSVDLVIYDYFAEYRASFGKKFFKKISYDENKSSTCLLDVNEVYKNLFSGRINAIWRKAFKKELLEIEELNEEVKGLSIGEDLFFSMKIMKKAKECAYICEPLYYWVQHVTSMTHTKYSFEKLDSFCRVLGYLYKDVLDHNMEKEDNIYKYFENTVLGIALNIALSDNLFNKKCKMYEFLIEQDFINFVSNDNHNKSIQYLVAKKYKKFEKTQKLNLVKIQITDRIKRIFMKGE